MRMSLYQDLSKRKSEGKAIRVAVSGAGWIGGGFVTQLSRMKGMMATVLADSDTGLARQVFESTGVPADAIVEAESVSKAQDALRKAKRVVTGSYSLAAQLPDVDIVVDVTPSPAIGAETAWSCIQNRKNVVMVNIEADVTVGRILKKLSDEAGILYTVSNGDEPGCIMELWDYVQTLGFQPIAIGKGKNNALNTSATPDTVAESARRDNKDPYQIASYVDGTKTMFEMTCVANATGCLPIKRGMVGPEASRQTVSDIFSLKEDGGICPFPGVVDFVQGSDMSGGVFLTVRVDNARLAEDLRYLKAGKGRYTTFFRPYHLWFIEAPISVARAHLYGEPWLVPLDRPVVEVLTIAKKDLAPGETLDAFGGYTFHGSMDRADEAMKLNALPVGLAPGAKIAKPVNRGAVISWDDVLLDETSIVVKLRRQQNAL
ncbi:MAG: NAD(P)-dependent oxidoreductase [Spirochaetia bacterium]|jgi:predicted homoserine dehydrogenase-like protein